MILPQTKSTTSPTNLARAERASMRWTNSEDAWNWKKKNSRRLSRKPRALSNRKKRRLPEPSKNSRPSRTISIDASQRRKKNSTAHGEYHATHHSHWPHHTMQLTTSPFTLTTPYHATDHFTIHTDHTIPCNWPLHHSHWPHHTMQLTTSSFTLATPYHATDHVIIHTDHTIPCNWPLHHSHWPHHTMQLTISSFTLTTPYHATDHFIIHTDHTILCNWPLHHSHWPHHTMQLTTSSFTLTTPYHATDHFIIHTDYSYWPSTLYILTGH